jgi:Cof subfamily protein (haloacid dehalogenase superfamily)
MALDFSDVKMLVTDLDGTVLMDLGLAGSRASEFTVEVFKKLQKRGVIICLASGRMRESMLKIAAEMGLNGPVISYNGAMISSATGETIYHQPLDTDISDAILELAEKRKLSLNFYSDGILYSKKFQPWWDLYEGRTASPMREVKSLLDLKGKVSTKLLFIAEPTTIKKLKTELSSLYAERANVLVTMDEYLEIMDPLVNKGRALEFLADSLKINLKQIIAAGDGYNDLEMLKAAGFSLAVNNGREELKVVADVLIDPPQKDGLGRYLEKIFNLKILENSHG